MDLPSLVIGQFLTDLFFAKPISDTFCSQDNGFRSYDQTRLPVRGGLSGRNTTFICNSNPYIYVVDFSLPLSTAFLFCIPS